MTVSAAVDAVVAALARQRVAAWSIVARDEEIGEADGVGARLVRRAPVSLTLHDDRAAGRGTGVAVAVAAGLDPDAFVAEARARARAAMGPPWQLPAPGGPARVRLDDEALRRGPVDEAAAALVDQLGRAAARPQVGAGPVLRRPSAVVRRTSQLVRTASGLALTWDATLAEVHATVGESTQLGLAARRLVDLDLAAAVDDAVARARGQREAQALRPGRYEVVLAAEALARGDGHVGPWQLLVAQADAARVRAGLSLYGPGDEVAPGSAAIAAPLTVRSDGARDFGLASAPLGDDGSPVRRFALVEGGRAAHLGLDAREAALRGEAANGGARDLVIDPGSASLDELRPGALEIVEARWVLLDEAAGAVLAAIDLARWHAPGGPRWVRGGWLRANGLTMLAHARRSREVVSVGRVHGPAGLGIGAHDLG